METADLYFEIPDPSVAADVMYIRAATAPTNAWIDYYNFKALIVQDDWVVDRHRPGCRTKFIIKQLGHEPLPI